MNPTDRRIPVFLSGHPVQCFLALSTRGFHPFLFLKSSDVLQKKDSVAILISLLEVRDLASSLTKFQLKGIRLVIFPSVREFNLYPSDKFLILKSKDIDVFIPNFVSRDQLTDIFLSNGHNQIKERLSEDTQTLSSLLRG